MLTPAKAIEAVSGVRACQTSQSKSLPEFISLMRRYLASAERAEHSGDLTIALHEIAAVSAFGVQALEQHGDDAREGAEKN